ncbi:MAG: glycosyltransferase [Angustibacter sp.]
MPTLLLRSGSALLSTHDCVGSPRPLLAVLRARLAQLHGLREVSTLTLSHDAMGQGPRRTLREDVAALAPVVGERSAGCDLVHALDLPAAATALAARRRTGVPVVVRDQPAARESAAREPRTRGGGSHAAWSAVLRAADGVVVPTTQDARAARAAGVPSGRITVCADAALVAGAQCDDPAADPSPSGENAYLLGLSGVPELPSVRAGLVAALHADRSLRIVLAGCADAADQGDRRDLVARAEQQDVADRIELRAVLPSAEMLDLVDGSAAVVATRSDPSCALSALVAMHRARPVVGVRSVSADDVLVDGVTGRLVDAQETASLARALVQAASDPFRRLSWGLAGLDRVSSRYDREVVMASMLQAYERAVEHAA